MARRALGAYVGTRPFCVSFEITRSCNARCKHCHLGGRVQEERASPQRYAEICRETEPLVALVSGGEPLLRNDVVEIIKGLKTTNGTPYIAMTTNGWLLTRERYRELREAGVDRFSISLDYPDERHDEFRGMPGLFRRIEALVDDLGGDGDRAINISAVVQRDNFRDLIRIAELGMEWGVRVNLSTYTWLRTENKDYLLSGSDLPEFGEIVEQLIQLKRVNKNIRTSDYVLRNMIRFFENGGLPDCRAGERYFVVNPDGTFSPCGLIIREYRSVADMRSDFTSTNQCQSCYTSLRADCERPLSYLARDSVSTTV
jgi:MoaA/NifB/PqqE/SkfB family radical SAM enzyme